MIRGGRLCLLYCDSYLVKGEYCCDGHVGIHFAFTLNTFILLHRMVVCHMSEDITLHLHATVNSCDGHVWIDSGSTSKPASTSYSSVSNTQTEGSKHGSSSCTVEGSKHRSSLLWYFDSAEVCLIYSLIRVHLLNLTLKCGKILSPLNIILKSTSAHK